MTHSVLTCPAKPVSHLGPAVGVAISSGSMLVKHSGLLVIAEFVAELVAHMGYILWKFFLGWRTTYN